MNIVCFRLKILTNENRNDFNSLKVGTRNSIFDETIFSICHYYYYHSKLPLPMRQEKINSFSDILDNLHSFIYLENVEKQIDMRRGFSITS